MYPTSPRTTGRERPSDARAFGPSTGSPGGDSRSAFGRRRPLRFLALLAGGAGAAVLVLLASVAAGRSAGQDFDPPFRTAAAQVDAGSLARADTTDSLLADTTDSLLTALADSILGAGALASLDADTTDSLRAVLIDSLRSVLIESFRARLADTLAAEATDSILVNATDSVLTALADSLLGTDTFASLRADTTDSLQFRLAEYYLPRFRADSWTASPVQRSRRPFHPGIGSYWQHQVTLDSTRQEFTVREYVGDVPVRYPLTMDYESYRQARLKADLLSGWRSMADQRAQQRERESRGGLGFNIVVPGGQQSAFTTIFGKPQVDLRVNGQADIKAGFDYRKSDQQVAVTGRAAQMDPDFKQDLVLGITGTIGDKLRVDVNWNTNNQFDFQNQLRLQYEGYDDEIIQSIQAGNVQLSIPSRLIRGGQSLFGILSEFQLGGLHLKTVASQQEGQSNSLSIEGGSQTTEFGLNPTDYDDNTHFFLGYYFRNRWEDALSNPPQVFVFDGFETITDIEVWKLEPTSPEEENVRQAVAMVDLGEPEEVVTLANGFTTPVLPNPDTDRYDDATLRNQLRDGNANPQDHLVALGLADDDFQVGKFKKLRQGTDYEFDTVLGYLSLNQRTQESEALAVAYKFQAGGRVYQVGDFASQTGGSSGGQKSDRIVLKLLKPVQLRQPSQDGSFNPAAWYLELRNIYRLPGRGLNPNDFDLQVEYQPPGRSASKVVPDLNAGSQRTLLQLLGLDRLNTDGAERPDDRFDYLVNFTIDPQDGELIFPYLEPFGSRIDEIIENLGDPEAEKQQKKNQYVFNSLYKQKKELAARETQFDVYRINGAYKGSVQDFYDLRAFAGLVEGSVSVTSGGSRLSEGADYVVDYQGGTVTITNPAYLTAGRDVQISYEQNSYFNLQKKTLLGARAEYVFGSESGTGQNCASASKCLGMTVFNLNQKSPIDKFRIGEEPISNTIWGLDGVLDIQPQWLTRAIDALPFIQTRAPSSIQITGEFAQLRPGASQTVAFERSRSQLTKNGLDFKSDELRGISYLDDFEGFETTYSLRQPGGWRLSAAPDSIGLYPGTLSSSRFDSLRTNWRGTMGWYTVHENVLRELLGNQRCDQVDPAVCQVPIKEVFPNKDTRGDTHPFLQPLDVYFNPHQRGPYNFTRDLGGFLNDPKSAWGGMIQRLPEGYTDFATKNIEFVEFIVKVFPEGGGSANSDARLYVDLGSISEDVIPNGQLNTEDGLTMQSVTPRNLDKWSRTAGGTQNSTIDVDDQLRRTEDLGLDGLGSYSPGDYEDLMTEQFVFRDFLDALDGGGTDPAYRAEVARAQRDPSGDDYFYFGASEYFDDPTYYPNGASIQERFSRYFPSTEINSFEAQNKLAPSLHGKRGNSRIPDTEDLNLNSAIDTDNSYYQYELPLSKAALDSLARPDQVNDYVVTEITEGFGWYQIRIPVRDFTRKVGNIQDFSLIESIRVWTTGHDRPVTLRFPTFELVGAQWQKSDRVALETELPSDTLQHQTRLSVSSINNEENTGTYATPNGTIISQNRLATGQTQMAREQAMVLRVENLMPGKQRAIFKTYSQGLDLLKYSNLRMFSHMHGLLGDGTPVESRDKVKLFLRFGANESNDYYEYEMPLSPSSVTSGNADALWQTNQMVGGEMMDLNSVNLVLGALNQLKVSRDEYGFPSDSIYWSDINEVPLSPAVEEFAPPGTRLAIKGSPSLGRVSTVVIGVRNAADSTIAGGAKNRNPQDILEDVTVWVNEMRVSGYDETNGWAALANADIRLADLGSIKASWQNQTDGFGGLESTLGQRDQVDLNNWSVTTDVNLDKFVPERYGWSIPVSVQVANETRTPRFSPSRGDIRLEELVSQIDEDDNLTEAEREQKKEEAIAAAQTTARTQSFNTRIQKSNSDSRLLRNTIDGVSFNYSLSNTSASNPSQRLNDNWRWSTTLGYRLNIPRPRTVRPFWFLDGLPLLGVLGGLDFNYVPQSITLGATAARNFSESQDRRQSVIDPDVVQLPDFVEFPLRQTHALSHRRNATFQYNPFQFLNLSFDANTNQSLNALGVDTLFTVIIQDSLGQEQSFANMTAEGALADGMIDTTDTYFEIATLDVVPTGQIVNRIFSGADGLRTDQHNERYTASFRPNLSGIQWLDWISVQDFVYGSQFRWQNGSVGRNTGASIGNQLELRGGVSMRPQELFRKISFYESLEQAQRDYEQRKQAERQERQQAREQERARREQERARLEEERQEAEAGTLEGEPAEDPEAGIPADDVESEGDQPEGVPPVDGEFPEEDGAEAGDPAGEEVEDGGGFSLPLPNPVVLARRTLLALTGIRDMTITYSANQSASSSNVGRANYGSGGSLLDVDTPYGLIDAILGDGPPVGYRLGFDRHVPLDQRIISQNLQVTDALSDGHQIQGRATLSPSQTFQINLNWNANWDERTNQTYRRDPGVSITETFSGSNRASVWAFNASYLDLFQRQLDTYRQDFNRADDKRTFGDANGDGRVVLTNESIVSDFQQTFLSGLGTVDGRGFLPFPMPNWQVTYSGVGQWPIIRKLVNNASLRHGYSSDYSTDYRRNLISADSMRAFELGGQQILFTLPEDEVGGMRVNERFQPLIGLDLTIKGGIQTSVAWEKSTSYTLSTTNFEVSQNDNNQLTVTANYSRSGLKLPFFKKLNNRVSFSLTFSRANLTDQRLSLRRGLTDYIETTEAGEAWTIDNVLSGDNVSVITASTRYTVVPRISYQFSNRVAADFTLRYENFISEDSRQPSATNINGGFNFRVSIAN